jgi:RNA polymerase sigma-70 factor (ECF subfamily)
VDALHHAYRVGRAAWPALELPEPALHAFVTERVEPEELTVEALDKLPLADLYLACACLHRVPGAHELFETACLPAIDAALARMNASQLADELKQMVMAQLFVGKRGEGAITTYTGRGNLRGWIRIIAVREAARMLRAQKREVSEDEEMFDVLAPTEREDPALEYLKSHYREQFKQAFLRAVTQLPRRERTALRMNVLDGRSIDKIGTTYRVNRSTAHRWLVNARELLITHTKTELMRELAIDAREVDSVIRLVRSSIDLTLDTVLRSRG